MDKFIGLLVKPEKFESVGWKIIEKRADCTTLLFSLLAEDGLTMDEWGLMHHRGMSGVFVEILVLEGKLKEIQLAGRFTPCSGRAIGGKAPAWIYPEGVTDRIELKELPREVAAKVRGAVKGIVKPPSRKKAAIVD